MIAAVLCIAVGGVGFEEVDIPDLYIGHYAYLVDVEEINYRHADLNDDGRVDLLLPTRAYLRQSDRFDPDQFISMPEFDTASRIDFWGTAMYVLSHDSVAAYELVDGAWNRTLDIDHEWEKQELLRLEPEDDLPIVTFERFLHDVDDDGRPEIVRTGAAGITINVVESDRIVSTHLDLYPPPRLLPFAGHHTLWPPSERRISFPNRKSMFQVVIDGGTAMVVQHVRQKDGAYSFHVERYRIARNTDGKYHAEHESSNRTEILPRHILDPLTLNNDDTVDYAGYRYERPSRENWKPLQQGFATTDGGKTIQIATTRGFRSRTQFVDLNGDGNLDWIGEESGLISGGLRETANRALFQRKLSHTIKARMQNGDGAFESKWRTLGRFTIHLDEPPRHLTHRFWQYRMGDLIDYTGDFNADGWRDALVYDRPESISLFLGGPDGFSAHAETALDVPPHTLPVAIDIDGDGLSDVAIMKRGDFAPVAIHLNTDTT